MSQNDALDELMNNSSSKNNQTPTPHDTEKVINGLRTCGPLLSAVFSHNSNNHKEDFEEILTDAKSLIETVTSSLEEKGIQVDHLKKSGINAFCIKVAAESWINEEEVIPDLSSAITTALVKQGISAELDGVDFDNPKTQSLMTNISAFSAIFAVFKKQSSLKISDDFTAVCMSELSKATERAIRKLEQFHIPLEDTDVVRHHITIEGCNILIAIIERNIENYLDTARRAAVSGSGPGQEFSFEQTGKDFNAAIDVFIQSIYVNSRVID